MTRPETMLLPFRQRLDFAGDAMNDAIDERLVSLDHRLKLLKGRLALVSPDRRVETVRSDLVHAGDRLGKAMARQLERKTERAQRLASQLRALDPTGILARGYSILMDGSKKVVRSHTDIAAGASLHAVLHDGSLDATVTETSDE